MLRRVVLTLLLAGSSGTARGAELTAAPVATTTRSDPVLAREHWQRGASAFRLGRFTEAVAAFEAAYAADPRPEFLFNIAQAHRNQGVCERAAYFYKSFAHEVTDAGRREQALRAAEDCTPEPAPAPQALVEMQGREVDLVTPAASPADVASPPLWRSPWFWGGVAVVLGAVSATTYLLWPEDARASSEPPLLGTVDGRAR